MPNQQWSLDSGALQTIDGLCLDMTSFPAGDEDRDKLVIAWPCHGGSNQQWSVSEGQLVASDGTCVDMTRFFAGDQGQGRQVITWQCHGGSNQQWRMVGVGVGYGAPPPRLGSSFPSRTSTCEGKGNPCKVHPPECIGRGSDWVVNGTIECSADGKARCTAEHGKDYCNRCGGDCGGCFGEGCFQSFLCSPDQQCVNYRTSINATPRWQCREIGQGCTRVQGLCWTKEEVGKAQVGCVEGRQYIAAAVLPANLGRPGQWRKRT